MNPPSIINLVRRVNEREDCIETFGALTVTTINNMLCEALLQGQDLLELKARTQHGGWLPWLRVNCPKISERRAQRYMALARGAPMKSELAAADSLRAALALCDLEGEKDREPKHWPAYQESILRLSKLRGFIEKNPMADWPTEAIDKFAEDLLPLARAVWPEKF